MRISAAAVPVVCLALCLLAAPASAQYGATSTSERATGENYHVEVAGALWFPAPDISITSEALGIIGSKIDFVEDLGIEKSTFKQLRVVLRPSTRAKFRFEYTPIGYTVPRALLKRNIIFNGISYPIALPVSTELDWKAYRFGFEYDFLYKNRGFVGFLLEAKYTDVEATLSNALDTEYVHARAPIPAVGFIGRGYVAPNISITGEFSFFKIPGGIDKDYGGNYYDFDLYGTVNFTDHFGAQAGYRSFDVFYHVDKDEGNLSLQGLYFGGLVRF
jgi:hypothetical protein